jgi:thioester reductase-like protein
MRLCSARTLKQFVFVSSIAASLRSANADGIIEERSIDDQRKASSMGYGQSKLLTERLAKQCAARFGMPVTIARVGQIAGDTVNGSWNTSEHVSLMIKAIETLGAMPDHYANVDFLPVDVVAATISTLLTHVRLPGSSGDGNESSPNLRVSHLVNPIMLQWIDFLKILQAPEFHLDFDIVDAHEWLRRLEESEADPVANPIKKLQGYFVDLYSAETKQEAVADDNQQQDKDKKARSGITFETDHTTKLVPTMRYHLDPAFWHKVIRYWRSIGFLRTPLS